MSKTILVIDDSASMRQMISMTLRGAGYSVVEAQDGKDALSKLDGSKYNLIVSDVNMPNMDGLSFVKAAKQLPAYKFTPVIMLTTEAGEAKKPKARPQASGPGSLSPFSRPCCSTPFPSW